MTHITADISFYPLDNNYLEIIQTFLSNIHDTKGIAIETTDVSTIITGEYTRIMEVIEKQLKPFLESGEAVFVLKLSNACGKREHT